MRKRILIVEDNEMNRRMLRDLMTYYGYEIIEAENGKSGIKLAKELKPDLILMDMQMPVLDGFTTTSLLKHDNETKDIPILAVTSFAMICDREKVLQAGADDYMSKPLDTRELPERVKKLIQ